MWSVAQSSKIPEFGDIPVRHLVNREYTYSGRGSISTPQIRAESRRIEVRPQLHLHDNTLTFCTLPMTPSCLTLGIQISRVCAGVTLAEGMAGSSIMLNFTNLRSLHN